MSFDVVYTTSFEPDPGDALAVLAFVLTPIDAFARSPEERAAVAAEILPAKRAAIARWAELQKVRAP